MSSARTGTRLVYLKLAYPYTVEELDYPKVEQMFTQRDRVSPDHYARVPIGDVPPGNPRGKICTPARFKGVARHQSWMIDRAVAR
jgi:hypothetical protein